MVVWHKLLFWCGCAASEQGWFGSNPRVMLNGRKLTASAMAEWAKAYSHVLKRATGSSGRKVKYVAGVVTVEQFAEEYQRRIAALTGYNRNRKRKLGKLIA